LVTIDSSEFSLPSQNKKEEHHQQELLEDSHRTEEESVGIGNRVQELLEDQAWKECWKQYFEWHGISNGDQVFISSAQTGVIGKS